MLFSFNLSKMAELTINEFLIDYSSSLLKLSLSDNVQTWLYCTHESNPNSIVDFSNFLWDSAFYNVCASVPAEAAKGDVNTTISPQKVQSTSINRRTKLKHPNKKNISSLEYSSNLAENSSLIKELPVQSTKLKIKCNNEDNSIIELNDTNLVSQLAIDESLKTNAKKSITNILDSTLKNSSDSYNISERTLVFNISAPKGFMDSTLTSNTPPDFSLSSKFNFNPNSVSTPTKKLIHICTDEISITRENINEPLSNTLTLEDKANDTYSVSLSNEESNDRNDDIKFDVTTTISTSYMETGKAADPVEESEPNSALQNTYIFEEATETLSANNDKILANSIENVISTEDSINNKLEESQNFPYNSDADFNSTITIKSKENDDSEEDSCYSSSSNIRSLGDVCDMSQLQTQKNSNLGCTLTKTRSENSLCLPEPVCNSRKPKTYYGSAVNLGTHNTNQLTAERRIHQNPNYFLRCPGNEVAMPKVNLPINNAGHVSMEKSIIPTRVSKIPRLQSKIPKLVTKK